MRFYAFIEENHTLGVVVSAYVNAAARVLSLVTPNISTLDAHIALDEMVACHERLRNLVKAAQNGEYTRAVRDVVLRHLFRSLSH